MWNEIPVKWNPPFIYNGMLILTISLPNRRTPPQYGWFLWWVGYEPHWFLWISWTGAWCYSYKILNFWTIFSLEILIKRILIKKKWRSLLQKFRFPIEAVLNSLKTHKGLQLVSRSQFLLNFFINFFLL